MAGVAAQGVGDLVAATGAAGGEERLGGCGAHPRQHAELADPERHRVMLGLVAEGAGHAAAGRIEGLDLEFGDQLQGFDRGADRARTPSDGNGRAAMRCGPALAPMAAANRPAARSVSTNSSKSCAWAASALAGAPGSSAGYSSRRVKRHEGSSPTIGAPAATSRGERIDHALRLDPRLVDQAGGEKGPAAAQRPAALGVRAEDAIAGARQHPLGGAGVLGLEPTVECVDQQHDLAAVPG